MKIDDVIFAIFIIAMMVLTGWLLSGCTTTLTQGCEVVTTNTDYTISNRNKCKVMCSPVMPEGMVYKYLSDNCSIEISK